jgi:hypothetical protein
VSHDAVRLTHPVLRWLFCTAQAKLEAKEREHFKKKGISFEGK